jgi:hypothetical protein
MVAAVDGVAVALFVAVAFKVEAAGRTTVPLFFSFGSPKMAGLPTHLSEG